MKNQKGFTFIEILGVIFIATLLLVTGFFVFKHEHKNDVSQTASCEPSQSMIKSEDYDVPCSLIVLLNGPPYANEATLQNAVKPIDGSVDSIDPEDGIYGVKVKAGTEEKSIDLLKKQSIIKSVTRDHCCVEPNGRSAAK